MGMFTVLSPSAIMASGIITESGTFGFDANGESSCGSFVINLEKKRGRVSGLNFKRCGNYAELALVDAEVSISKAPWGPPINCTG